jgi:serine/threonine-protein kinase
MKPANIMLKPSGDVVLIDFGTAREYKEASQGDTTWLGTRGYAAPEQFGGKGQTDARTDIYNLGATLYHLLTGYSPADTHFEILPLDQLNPKLMEHGFVEIVSRCCMSNPEDRYQSDAEVMYALEHIDDVGERARRDRKKKLRRFTAAALTALAGAVGVLAFTLAGNSARAGSYDGYLEAAASASSFSDAASYYEQAVKLKPTDPDAYEQMVNAIQSDFQFTQEENDALFRILNAHNGASRANIDRLASSEEERYVKLAYQIAHQYYFFYEGSDNRAKAAYWYERVQDSEFLSDQERELAKSLCSIGKYYSSLGSTNNDYAIGENAQNYGTFWEDLVSITDGNVVEKTGGAHYAVALYQEFSNQIFNHAREFREFGITKDEMLTQIAKMEAGLRDLGDSGSENVRERIRKTRSNLVNARQTVESAFAAVG